MKINIITNHNNGAGLQRDAEMLESIVSDKNTTVNMVHFTELTACHADVNIFLETLVTRFVSVAKRNVFVPNLEYFPVMARDIMENLDEVWCKTEDTMERLKHLPHAVYTGWLSKDRYDPFCVRKREVLHIAGKSPLKNTEAVVKCWHQCGENLPHLHVVYWGKDFQIKPTTNMTLHGQLPESKLMDLMNECLIHLQPSATEGFGHCLHEAMSTYNVVVTTNAAPMNESFIDLPELLVEATKYGERHGIPLYVTPTTAIYNVVRKLATSQHEQLTEAGKVLRNVYDRKCGDSKRIIKSRIERFRGASNRI